MSLFRYCPRCASPLGESHLATEDRARLVCTREGCGYIHYINPKIVCGTLPVHEGKVWLLRRGIEPRMGYWTYPAGFQEWDETTEEAAIRETREEIGCNVELDGLMGVYSRAGAPVVNIVYLGRFGSRSNSPCTTKEALEVRSFAPNEVPWDDLAFPSTTQVIRDWVERVTSNGT